jgi:hypothetical protein
MSMVECTYEKFALWTNLTFEMQWQNGKHPKRNTCCLANPLITHHFVMYHMQFYRSKLNKTSLTHSHAFYFFTIKGMTLGVSKWPPNYDTGNWHPGSSSSMKAGSCNMTLAVGCDVKSELIRTIQSTLWAYPITFEWHLKLFKP